MSRKHQQKQLEKSRARRQAARAQERSRNRLVGAVVGGLLLVAAIVGVWWLLNREPAPDAAAEVSSEAAATEAGASEAGASAPAGAASAGAATNPCPVPGPDAPTADTDTQFPEPPPAELTGTVTATIETTCGTIVAELDADAAPQAVSGFAFLAEQDFYAGTPFHRVQADFVIQGGDPTGTGSGGPGYSFDDELDLAEQVVADNDGLYPRGTLAMANSGPDTNGSQFFVVQADPGYPFPPDYVVFGMVTEGMDVVDDIANGQVTGDRQDEAVDPTVITSVSVQPS